MVNVSAFVCCLFAAGMGILVPSRSSAQSSADRIRTAADSLLLALHARGLFNGAVVLGFQEEVYARAFGPANLEAGVHFSPDTPADGGSIAKALTAAAIFMLQDDDNEGFYGGSNLYLSARDLFRWSRSFYIRPVLSEAARTRGMEAAVLGDLGEGKRGRSALDYLSWYYPDGG